MTPTDAEANRLRAALETALAERDQARRIAVTLEQEVAAQADEITRLRAADERDEGRRLAASLERADDTRSAAVRAPGGAVTTPGRTTPLPSPSACAHCGEHRAGHFQRWSTHVGWHKWAQPSTEQMAARYHALRTTPIARRGM